MPDDKPVDAGSIEKLVADFIDTVVEDLKSTGSALWDKIRNERKPIVTRSLARIAELSVMRVLNPDLSNQFGLDIAHNHNILLSELAVAEVLTERAFFEFQKQFLLRLLGIMAVLVG